MLSITDVSFRYNDRAVINNVSAIVNSGDCLAVVGESGCGKSTLLKLIFGQMDVDRGAISWHNQPILGPKNKLVVGHDFMKYVAQEFDLMPYTTVSENIGDHLSNFYPEEKKRRTAELIAVVELTPFAKTKVKHLSGGQKQRVALAQALANTPEIILLDEPFSHIDNFKKQSLRRSVFKYLKEKNITCIVATHDKEDVLGLADKMIVLHDNKVLVNDAPQALYKDPKTPLIASFFGEYNVINKEIVYANQLKVVAKSNLKAVVIQSYYKGHYYLTEGISNKAKIYFEHPVELKKNASVFIEISK